MMPESRSLDFARAMADAEWDDYHLAPPIVVDEELLRRAFTRLQPDHGPLPAGSHTVQQPVSMLERIMSIIRERLP